VDCDDDLLAHCFNLRSSIGEPHLGER